jgi:hypothetical protein
VLPERPAQWAPPPADHNVTLLPDLFYAAYPMSVPTDAQDMPDDGISFQMGVQTCSAPHKAAAYDIKSRHKLAIAVK